VSDVRSSVALDDDGGSEAGDLEELLREGVGQVNAAVAFGVSGEAAGVECDASPGEALLIVHGSVVVDVGVMIGIFLEDGEDAGGSLVAFFAGGDGGDSDADSVAVD